MIRDKKKGAGNITDRINGWSKALNAFAITHGDHLDPP
jgi:hypothetical protein